MSEQGEPLYRCGRVECDDNGENCVIVMTDRDGVTHALAGFKSRAEAEEAIRERLTWARE